MTKLNATRQKFKSPKYLYAWLRSWFRPIPFLQITITISYSQSSS